MRFWTWVKIGGAIVSGAYSAYSIASQICPFPSGASITDPPWISISIAFGIFVFFVIWGWASASWKLHEHENIHPKVTVQPIIGTKLLYLEVTNNGSEKAAFKVQVLSVDGLFEDQTVPNLPFDSSWNNNSNTTNKAICELIPDERNRVIIVNDKSLISFPTDTIRLYTIQFLSSDQSPWNCKVQANTKIDVTIQIASFPKLKSPYKKTFSMMIGDDNNWALFEEAI